MGMRTWEEIGAEVDALRDRLGMPVDAGIRDAVIALRRVGISTSMSCEGHAHRAIAAPWVDIKFPHIDDLLTERSELLKAERMEEVRLISQRIAMMTAEALRPLVRLLSEFYELRSVPFHQRLIINSKGISRARLISQGFCIQDVIPFEDRCRNLELYQAEMHAFAGFLKSLS